MGLEIRGTKKYFYRSRRINGRVVKEYVGSGERAEEAARKAEEAARQNADFLKFKAQNKVIKRKLDELNLICKLLYEAHMYAAGYHRPNRGPWRKRRVPKNQRPPEPSAPSAA